MNSFLPESVVRRNRAIQELLTLVREVIEDGVVTAAEAETFNAWLDEHPDMTGISPVNILVPPLRRIFSDQIVTDEERTELLELLTSLAGEDNPQGPDWGRLHRDRD